MSIQAQKERLELAKYNWRVALDYLKNPPLATDSFADYVDYLSDIRFCEIPVEFDYKYGWIGKSGSTYGWHYQNNSDQCKNPIDIYEVKKDHNYFIVRGADCVNATRFRVCVVAEDVRTKTSGSVAATQYLLDQKNPTEVYATLKNGVASPYKNPDYSNAATPFFRAEDDGWLLIQKDDQYTTGLTCFVFDLSTPVEQVVDPILDESLFDIDYNGIITLKSSVDRNKIIGDRIVPDTVGGVTVTGIGDNCFEDCYTLNSIEFPSTVTSIGDHAFASAGLTSFTFPSTVTSVGDSAFQNCRGLTSITVPSTVSSFGADVFRNCLKLTSATINASITSMEGTFYDCTKLTSVTIPSTVTNIPLCFYSVPITTLPSIPNVAIIQDRAFFNTKLKDVVVPNGVISLDWHSFRYCSDMISITLPSSLVTLNSSAISRDRRLRRMEFLGTTPPTISADPNVPLFISTCNCPIYVPDAAVNTYKEATGWSDVVNRIVGTSNRVRPIGGTVFYIDSRGDGTYTFYDANGDITSAPTVGTDCTGWTYTVTGDTKDKYFVYDSTTGRVQDKCWGYYNIDTNTSGQKIGDGKINTWDTQGVTDTSSDAANSIFYYLFNTQNAGQGTNGCIDWYIGSRFEVDALIEANLEPTWFDPTGDIYMWCASHVNNTSSYMYTNYHLDSPGWHSFNRANRGSDVSVFFIRSF